MTSFKSVKSRLYHAGLLTAFIAALGLITASIPAEAFDSSDEPAPKPRACKKGYFWSKSRKKCLRRRSDLLNDADRYDYGYRLAKHGQYAKAIDILSTIKNQHDPKVLTYIGYSHRKMGRFATGVSFYKRAIAIDPTNIRAREYLGEGYVAKGKLKLARLELDQIRNICGTNCPEYKALVAAIKTGPKTRTW